MENHILKGLHLDGDRDVTDNNCDGDKPFSPYVHIGPLTVTEQRERSSDTMTRSYAVGSSCSHAQPSGFHHHAR